MKKSGTQATKSREVLDGMASIIVNTFAEFKVPVDIVEAVDGYSGYHFYLRPKKAMRMKAFASFADDLKYALSNDRVEIIAPVPNKKLVGITVPKQEDLPIVPFTSAIKWEEFTNSEPLTIPLGLDEFGKRYLINLALMPHLLIAGTTGSGKSVLLHSILNALIEKNNPDQVRLILIDPKRVELSLYDGLPHLLTKPLGQPRQALRALSWAIKEMTRRYDILHTEKVPNIDLYHKDVYAPAKQQSEKKDSKPQATSNLPEPLPYIVIIIDELNDLIQAYPSEMEVCIVRLAQLGRAVGIHLLITTQRPAVNVITGAIKANIPARIALMVASQIDSRTILDVAGAEKLRGGGDILLQTPDNFTPQRLQSLFITEAEIVKRIMASKKLAQGDLADTAFASLDLSDHEPSYNPLVDDDGAEDELFEEAKQAVIEVGKASTSYLQRKLRIGYSRAARLIDLLEAAGVIGPADGTTPREVLG